MDIQLNARDAAVLHEVVASYLDTGEPVGSQSVSQLFADRHALLSSATIRHVMADLESLGLLMHPHTSAGRVPTPSGLRYYLDCLVEVRPLPDDEREQIAACHNDAEPRLSAVTQEASRILARLSRYAGLVVAPTDHHLVFRHMEFVKLSARRLLGIFVTREGETRNRVIEMARELSYRELERINNYCNAAFVGLSLPEARTKALAEQQRAQHELDELWAQAMRYSGVVLGGESGAQLLVEGEARLLSYPEFDAAPKIRQVLELLSEQACLLRLLDHAEAGPEVRVFIGAESGFDALQDCSIVISPYRRHQQTLGTLGVIGPTRMAYGRVIPIVQCAAAEISRWIEMQ